MLNKVILIGRLTRDPELRHTPNGASVCQFTLAVDRIPDQNGQRQADFISVIVWNKLAENLAKYMSKGRLIAVEGRIQVRNYENNEGKRVYVTEIIATNIQFLESRNASNTAFVSGNNYEQVNNSYVDSNPQPMMNNTPMETVDIEKDPFESFGESVAISDNDLPF